MPKKWPKMSILAYFRSFLAKTNVKSRHDNSQNSLNRGLIVVLKVTVYRRTMVENYSEKVQVEIFDQKVQKTGFIPPPIFGGGELGFRWGWAQRVKGPPEVAKFCATAAKDSRNFTDFHGFHVGDGWGRSGTALGRLGTTLGRSRTTPRRSGTTRGRLGTVG